MQKRRASIPSKGWKVSISVVQERIEKERKQSKIRHCRGENGYQKEELAQEEKYDEKTRGPTRPEGSVIL